MLTAIVVVIDVITALFLIVFVLLHSGKGSGLSDMFGGTSTLSGGTSLEKRLDRLTVISAIVFGLCTFYLSWQWTPR
ncbi:MAG: preprotein translocase subunit SecG [Actinomycetota bacterium]